MLLLCKKNRSVYIERNSSNCEFNSTDSWNVFNPLEYAIRDKINKKGIPLSKWEISINYGIKTGFNEAFIITGEKKDELIAKDPKSAEIIRPILRGKDIKRYVYSFSDLWIIATFPSRHYVIDDYPAVKSHLLSFGIHRLEQTGKKYQMDGITVKARKKTHNKWFETQDSINYWNNFLKQKTVYREIYCLMNACLVELVIMLKKMLLNLLVSINLYT